jgi:hypothetical protein
MFRYRTLDENYDMMFGRGGYNFLVDNPTAVAQSVLTRLQLWMGEWWLDLNAGTPWLQQVLGKPRGPGSPDAALRARISGTPFVTRLYDYASSSNTTARTFTVSCKVNTAFGPVLVAPAGALISPTGALVMPLSLPAVPGVTDRAPQRALITHQPVR